MIKNELSELKQHIYRATSITFLFQLFGAMGGGCISFLSDFFNIDILGRMSGPLLQYFFWATDFYFIALAVALCYLIAGITAVAPALTLGVYFAHFAGLYTNVRSAVPMYADFFTTPYMNGGGVNIGYLGYLIMALIISYIIRVFSFRWEALKHKCKDKTEQLFKWLGKKIKPLQAISDTDGFEMLSNLDLFFYILIFPVIAGLIAYFIILYGIATPFGALGDKLGEVLANLYESSHVLGSLLMGLMVGFDTVGPLSRSAFTVASDMAQLGDVAMVTSYGLCFATLGWVSFVALLINKIFKKGGKFDTDDGNLATSGPINAFFDNMKLTVSFAMSYACRDPFKVIPCYMLSSGIVGVLSSAFKLANPLYLETEKRILFAEGELYISFEQPMRSMLGTPRGVLLPVCCAVGAIVGGALLIVLKERTVKRQTAEGTYVEPNSNIVREIREFALKSNKKS